MRKLFLFCFIALCACKAFSMQIQFHASITDPTVLNPGNPKSPIQPPTVYIEDYVLTFMVGHPECSQGESPCEQKMDLNVKKGELLSLNR